MALSHLLDTNVISRLMRDRSGTTAHHLARVGDDNVCTSIVVASELRFGAALRGSPKLTAAVEQVLDALPILPLEQPMDEHYADIRNELQARGTPIGPNDLLIAAQARSLGLALVTENTREFSQVTGLRVENWQS